MHLTMNKEHEPKTVHVWPSVTAPMCPLKPFYRCYFNRASWVLRFFVLSRPLIVLVRLFTGTCFKKLTAKLSVVLFHGMRMCQLKDSQCHSLTLYIMACCSHKIHVMPYSLVESFMSSNIKLFLWVYTEKESAIFTNRRALKSLQVKST